MASNIDPPPPVPDPLAGMSDEINAFTPPSDRDALPAGSRFGRYAIVRMLGAGGMGAVYEATHLDLKKRVALKLLHQSFAQSGEVRARFMREGEAASRISHANVVDVTDFGVHEGTPFLVMEYLDGESLAGRIAREPLPTVEEVVDWMVPVCGAVNAAHAAGVIHRDLKPENVFLRRTLDGDLRPKVVDFGVSKLVDDLTEAKLTRTNGLIGSPMYMAPEQVGGGAKADAATDQYALGVMLYEMLAGRCPFENDNLYEILRMIVHGEFKPPSTFRAGIPPGLEAVVLRAMNRDRTQRYPSVRALGAALLPYASTRTRLIHESSTSSPPEETASRAAIVGARTIPFSEPQYDTGPRPGLATGTPAGVTPAPGAIASVTAPAPVLAPPARSRVAPIVLVSLGLIALLGLFAFTRRGHERDPVAPAPVVVAQPLERAGLDPAAPTPSPTVAPAPAPVPVVAPPPVAPVAVAPVAVEPPFVPESPTAPGVAPRRGGARVVRVHPSTAATAPASVTAPATPPRTNTHVELE